MNYFERVLKRIDSNLGVVKYNDGFQVDRYLFVVKLDNGIRCTYKGIDIPLIPEEKIIVLHKCRISFYSKSDNNILKEL